MLAIEHNVFIVLRFKMSHVASIDHSDANEWQHPGRCIGIGWLTLLSDHIRETAT
jgi:hypothetical protein